MIVPKIENDTLILKGTSSGIVYDIEIPKGVSVFHGGSGEGKSFLFRKLLNLSGNPKCGYSASLCDYHNTKNSEEQLIILTESSSVVMFDNADLYLTPFVVEKVNQTADFVMVAARDLEFVGSFPVTFMYIKFDLDRLTVKPGGVLNDSNI